MSIDEQVLQDEQAARRASERVSAMIREQWAGHESDVFARLFGKADETDDDDATTDAGDQS